MEEFPLVDLEEKPHRSNPRKVFTAVLFLLWFLFSLEEQKGTTDEIESTAADGPRPNWVNQLMYRYLDRIFVQALRDPQVVRMLFEVLHLSAPPAALFHRS